METLDKKEKLKSISEQARKLKQHLINTSKTFEEANLIEAMRINDIIINHFYTDDDNTEFHSYKGWQELGYQVKKGSKAFLVWGKKRENIPDEVAEQTDQEQFEFFPMAFIFSNNQVFKIEDDK